MKRRLYLLGRALHRLHARYVYRQARARSKKIREEYTMVGAELLHALRAEAEANLKMHEINRKK